MALLVFCNSLLSLNKSYRSDFVAFRFTPRSEQSVGKWKGKEGHKGRKHLLLKVTLCLITLINYNFNDDCKYLETIFWFFMTGCYEKIAEFNHDIQP